MCNSKRADMIRTMLTSWLQQVFTQYGRSIVLLQSRVLMRPRSHARHTFTAARSAPPAKLGIWPEPPHRCTAGLQATLSPCAEQPAPSPRQMASLARAITQVTAGPDNPDLARCLQQGRYRG